MATTVVEMGPSCEKTTFSGSSEDDKAYAKTFWQSVQLLPPMESRLVSSDIKQRLKVAPRSGQPLNVTYPGWEQPSKLTAFLQRAKALEREAEGERLEKLGQKRQEDMALLHKHRANRIQKMRISMGHGVAPLPQLPSPVPDDELAEDFEEDPQEILQQLDRFGPSNQDGDISD